MKMQAGKPVGLLSNSESLKFRESWKKGAGVNLVSKRGTTQTGVKALKCWFSDKGQKVSLI